MYDLSKMKQGDIEQLIKNCESRLKEISKEKEKNNKEKALNKPMKSCIKDLEKFDFIYSIEKYPKTEDFKDGFRVLKCYISGISLEENDNSTYLNISIVNDNNNKGHYGMYVDETWLDKPYFLHSHMGDCFYTLDKENWQNDIIDAYDVVINKKKVRQYQEIQKIRNNLDVKISSKEIITKMLSDEDMNNSIPYTI